MGDGVGRMGGGGGSGRGGRGLGVRGGWVCCFQTAHTEDLIKCRYLELQIISRAVWYRLEKHIFHMCTAESTLRRNRIIYPRGRNMPEGRYTDLTSFASSSKEPVV